MVQPLSQTQGFTELSPSVLQQALGQPQGSNVAPEGEVPPETPESAPIPVEKPSASPVPETVDQGTPKAQEVLDTTKGASTLTPQAEQTDFFGQLAGVLSSAMDFFSPSEPEPDPGMELGRMAGEMVGPPTVAPESDLGLPEMDNYQSVLQKAATARNEPTKAPEAAKKGGGLADVIKPTERTPEQVQAFGQIDVKKETPLSPTEIIDTGAEKNWNFGTMKNPNALVIHHTGGRGTVEGVIGTFKQRGFPAHFIIDREGKTHEVLGLRQKGQHTRNSQINDVTNANSWGVEIMAKDDNDVTPQQAAAAIRLAKFLHEKEGMPLDRVFGHGEINRHKQKTEGKTVTDILRKGLSGSTPTV